VDHHDTLVAPAREPRGDDALVLGRYRLRERLGAGGFGVVWRAYDELLRREVALKRIPLPTADDRERARREALAGARLAHPAIVALYEAAADDEAFHLISELVHGETLAEAIAADDLDDDELLEIGVTLCDALAHAHGRGVVHRDVKPQNILLPGESTQTDSRPAIAKLTDFGGARLAGEEALTRTGDVLGTFAYMAPEQIEGREAGPAADLYALALVLYEGLSGVNPVRGPTPAATVRRIGRPLPPLGRLRDDLPRGLTRTLDAALRPDPEARCELAELRDALAGQGAVGVRRADGDAEARLAEAQPEEQADTWSGSEHGIRHGPDTEPGRDSSCEPELEPEPDTAGWLTAQRLSWLLAVLAVCAWQTAERRPGVALLTLVAVLPLVLMVRRPGPSWLAAGLAPLLGVAGLAGAYPALAGQAPRWRSRALLGALGYWWLALAGALLDQRGRTLWLALPADGAGRGAAGPAGAGGHLYRVLWEGSPGSALTHALAPLLGLGLLLGALLWALAAVSLPWLVRGRGAGPDALAALAWAVALAATTPLVDSWASFDRAPSAPPGPHGVILGAALGAALAVAARALRGRAGADGH
jgi:serine/threonine protein kinase